MKKIVTLCILLCCLVSTKAWTASNFASVLNNIYNCNFSTAQSSIDQIISSQPSNPEGYILRGMLNEWQQASYNKGTSLDTTIMQDYQKAVDLAKADFTARPNDAAAKVQLGNALVYLSKKQLDRGHKVQAGNTLKEATKLMNDVISQNPGQSDAYFAVGLFNYFSQNVPAGLRFIAVLLGFKGDKNKGISYIQKAANTPNITQTDAQFMLAYIYSKKERNFSAALPYATSLGKNYPQNPVFQFYYAEMLFWDKQYTASRTEFNKLLSYYKQYPDRIDNLTKFLLPFFMGWSYIEEKDYKTANAYILEADKYRDFAKTKDRIARLNEFLKLVQ